MFEIVLLQKVYILQMNEADTTEQIDQLLDQGHYMALVNACGWPSTQVISITNKNDLLQQLLLNEVIRSRAKQMQSFRKGLKVLGFQQLMMEYPKEFEELIVHHPSLLSVETLQGLIVAEHPDVPDQRRAYDYFMEYLSSLPETGT